MGNCSPKGITQPKNTPNNTIRVLTDSGSVLYFQGPKVVQDVVENFPGYGIFEQGRGGSSRPLSLNENLVTTQSYQLLPLGGSRRGVSGEPRMGGVAGPSMEHDRASLPGLVESLANSPGLEVLPMPRRGDGVWKVKLVIDTKQLEEILSEEVNVEALIERMRAAAGSSSGSNTNGTTRSPKRGKVKGGPGLKPSLSSIFRAASC
ncbi:uncharacterized protein LOC116205341 [Punica granatum]|uniref:Uncharacterized protein n=2 Tax=Punica granatum TaxID=22663 RepID=A0A218XK06_PUNGR|nr:uncharacterized protein LOC116205341 [Punica granatum]OWM85204.1 hypothetical protein CDL15_Pgr027991 [Punica granatum]OWM91615.1 hypothetical protein CDL15_Pgr022364 [Punica granatum]PKI51737.1 hypothetical protein CRG98_027900 [Punica granatum]